MAALGLLILAGLSPGPSRAPPAFVGGVGGTKRLRGKIRTALVGPPATCVLVDGTNLRGVARFRLSEDTVAHSVQDWAFQSGLGGRCVLCFDGGPALDVQANNVLVRVHSGPESSADDVIVHCARWATGEPFAHKVALVTADKALARDAQAVVAVHSSAFLDLVQDRSSRERAKQGTRVSFAPHVQSLRRHLQRRSLRSKLQMVTPAVDKKPLPPSGRIASLVGVLFAAGALLGPWLDGMHGAFGVLTYKGPLALDVHVGSWFTKEGILHTASWVPPLFGVAGVLIGGLIVAGDAVTGSAAAPPKGPAVALSVSYFTAQYWLSGLLYAVDAPLPVAHAILAASSLGAFALFDRTSVGLGVGALTALGGPGVEWLLVNVVPSALHLDSPLYHYNGQPLVGGLQSWIPWVYACGCPAVGGIARFAARQLALR